MKWYEVCEAWDNGSQKAFATTVDLGRRGQRIFEVRPTADFFEYRTAWLGINEPARELSPWKPGDDAEYRRAAANGEFADSEYTEVTPAEAASAGRE